MTIAIHGPIPTNCSIDNLCERFRAIELQKELRTTNDGGTDDDLVALLARQKGSKRKSAGKGEQCGKNLSLNAMVSPNSV